MAKKIVKKIKIIAQGGAATLTPAMGQVLGPAGINIGEFVKKFKNTNAGDLKEVYKEFDNNYVVFGFLDTNATKSLLNLIISGA